MSRDYPLGLGDPMAHLRVYMEHRFNVIGLTQLAGVEPLVSGEIAAISAEGGNGWRKVFSVYAKLVFALGAAGDEDGTRYARWQQYRDERLLQGGSGTALLFSPPMFNDADIVNETGNQAVHIIMGRTYAKQLLASEHLQCQWQWLDHEFALDKDLRLVVCPYFDYRQLTNVKLQRLVAIIESLRLPTAALT
ncbi:hypothetical protein [Shewanella sp. NIFS-20-20]|uniref:DUF6942 family protein n=1 Tax=Shewanella sp. NIFS-20-20 TaxID=2853806 RepID=UPI001C46B899|nr:hypothetical protein [Shewanella sp. NIFS-20-20]MBV7317425.1 hypothetical protein [Shewanella sp. NIFS-20-20]